MTIRDNIELKILGKFIDPKDKPLSDEFADKVRWAALGSLTAAILAAAPVVPSLLKKKISLKDAYKLKKIPAIISGAAMVPVGWSTPQVHNAYLEYLQKKKPLEEAQDIYSTLIEDQDRTEDAVTGFYKKSSLLSVTSKISKGVIGGLGSATTGVRKFTMKGLVGTPKSVKSVSKNRRTFFGGLHTWGARGGVGALGVGGLAGGANLYNSKRKLSGNNYTTFLRNNVLAGNIQQKQLSQQDMISVRRLGMR